jgi:hypothetical protein
MVRSRTQFVVLMFYLILCTVTSNLNISTHPYKDRRNRQIRKIIFVCMKFTELLVVSPGLSQMETQAYGSKYFTQFVILRNCQQNCRISSTFEAREN